MKTETLPPLATATPLTEAASARDAAAERIPPCIRLKNILVPLDLSEMSLKSLQYAVPFAKQFGARLTLLHVLRPPICPSDFPFPGPSGQDCFAAIQSRLDEIRDSHVPAELPTDTIVRQGFAFDGILEVAREIHTDLIISTTHGRTGLDHLLSGSIAENIARGAPCPVLVLREHEQDFV